MRYLDLVLLPLLGVFVALLIAGLVLRVRETRKRAEPRAGLTKECRQIPAGDSPGIPDTGMVMRSATASHL